MVDQRLKLKSWAAAAVFAAGGVFCSAQTTPAANAPIFSRPANSDTIGSESGESLPADNTSGRVVHDFESSAPLPPPGPSPDINPAIQKELNQKAEWTLMTPEEIMGLQTPEEIFGLKDEDQDQNASPEERYLKREEKAKTAVPPERLFEEDNGNRIDGGIFDRPDDNNPLFSPQDQTDPGVFSRMFNGTEASPFARKNGSLAGTRATTVNPVEKAKADQEEAAEMARFRSLIGEVPESPTPAPSVPHLDANPAPDPLSAFDPFGHPAVNHPVDLSRPGGLTLPPEIAAQASQPRKAKKPSWAPQLPPWLSDQNSPPSGPPLRKFY